MKSKTGEQSAVKFGDFLAWDRTHGKRFTHDFFKFPGKFHPPIVENILRRLKPNAVIDPMAGVGTVAVEAKAAGIPSLSIDVDPVGVYFTRVKTTPISDDTLKGAWKSFQPTLEDMRRSEEQLKKYRFEDITSGTMKRHLARIKSHHLSALSYWFRKYVLVDFARIDHAIGNGGLPHSSYAVRRFFTACLLSAIRRISNADPYPVSGLEITAHMRKKLAAGYDVDVVKEFERRVLSNMERMASYVDHLRENGTIKTDVNVVLDDCLNISKIKKRFAFQPDLVLFSPPYCNAIEYWRRHRLEYFLGRFMTVDDVSQHHKKFIGRRAVGGKSSLTPPSLDHKVCDNTIEALHTSGRRLKAWQLWHYFNDMQKRFREFYSVLPVGGHTVVVVGDSRTADHVIPTGRILRDLAQANGFVFEGEVQYAIKNRTMQYPLKNGESKISDESIILLKKPKRTRSN
jgi:DNA modification methylase